MPRRLFCATLLTGLIGLGTVAPAGDKNPDDGFVPMFNGKDLTGWVNVNCAPQTWSVRDGMIVTTGKPTGFLRTERPYENFIAEFDWMHVPPTPDAVGNSGFFVWADPVPAVGTPYTRGIEVQVLVNLEWKDKKTGGVTASSQGDLFSIWGAHCVPDRPHPLGWERCIPSENRAKGAGEWNHYRVEANDGVIKLAVNGKVVSGISKCTPRKGYLALESEGSECRFKNLKIKELASTNPPKEEVADVARGFKNLYTGLSLDGWTGDAEGKKHWQPRDSVLHYEGNGNHDAMRTENKYTAAEFIVDFRFPGKGAKSCSFNLGVDDRERLQFKVGPGTGQSLTVTAPGTAGAASQTGGVQIKPGQWYRLRLTMAPAKSGGGTAIIVAINGKVTAESTVSAAKARYLELMPDGAMDFMNLFARELVKEE